MVRSWQAVVNPLSDEKLEEERNRFRDTTPIEAIHHWVDEGNMPPPELLICLENCIIIYGLSAAIGEAYNLENVFFGPTKKGVGNHAQRQYSSSKRNQETYFSFHMYVANFKGLENDHIDPINYESLAVSFFDEKDRNDKRRWDIFPGGDGFKPSPQPDIDSFLRGYRRWKKNNISKNLPDS